jgi:hypothetical protein
MWAPLRRRPEALLVTVNRLLSFVPPVGFGRCLKRSLLLLDLWGRCGLRPTLHLGVRHPAEDDPNAHAWIETLSSLDPSLRKSPIQTDSLGYEATFRF